MPGLNNISVAKLDYLGNVRWQYTGELISISDQKIIIEAYFDKESVHVGDVILNKGDRFIETYFTNRWYDILEIHDRMDDHIKGWYCDIGYPVKKIKNNILSFYDLELDLFVKSNGNQVVLDSEKFDALDIDQETRKKALDGLDQVKEHFNRMFEDNIT